MRDLRSVFLDIINFHLSLFPSDYNLPVYFLRKVEYHVSTKDSLSWCGLISAVIRGPYRPFYRGYVFIPWIYIVEVFVRKIGGKKNI